MDNDKINSCTGINVLNLIFRILVLWFFILPLHSFASVWILVDTNNAALTIMDGEKVIVRLEDISVGRSGITDLHIKGDDKTPRGDYRIARINRESRFRTFFEINYPTIKHAQRAMEQGLIDKKTYTKIKISQQAYGHSPQNTKLGGHLGIHGLGAGSPELHEMFNWTNGCIALTNQQIDQLDLWVQLGTKVVIE